MRRKLGKFSALVTALVVGAPLSLVPATITAGPASASGTPSVSPGPGAAVQFGGVRYRSFANTGGNEVYLGTGLGGGPRVEQGQTWGNPSTNSISFTYDATAHTLASQVNGGTTLVFTGFTPSYTVNELQINVAERDAGATVNFNNVVLDPIDDATNYNLGNFTTDAPAVTGTPAGQCFPTTQCFWKVSGTDLRAGFTLTADLVLSGPFSGSQENDRVEIDLGYAPCTTVCYASNTGSDTNSGNSAADPFLTVQHAIDTVSVGGTVYVAAGTYNEQVSVNKTISLLGAQAGVDARTRSASESILAPPSAAPAGRTPLSVSADDTTIDGFTVQGNTYVPLVGAGVYLQPGSHGTQFLDNIVRNNVVGLFLANDNGSNPTLIRHNRFQDNTNPGASSGSDIYADNFTAGGAITGVTIDANKFTNSSFVEDGQAVDLENTTIPTQFSNITISNNAIDNHGRGVILAGTSNSIVTANAFTPGATNHYGLLVWDLSPYYTPVPNSNITVDHNTLGCGTSCAGIGVSVLDPGATGIAINRNSLGGLTSGISSNATSNVDGTCNWWGAANGPGPVGSGSGSGVSTGVNFASWLVSSNLAGACTGSPGPTVPAAPTIGSATATTDVGAVLVSFTPGADGGSPITGFTVTCVSLVGHPSVSASGPASPVTVTGLVGGTPYQCSVTATNAIGTGPPSGVASVVFPTAALPVLPCTTPMSAPTRLTTAPGNGSAVVSWSPSVPNPGCVAGYVVTPYLGSVAQVSTLVPGHGTTTVISGLVNGQTYRFTVAAEDGHKLGPVSALTDTVTAGAPGAATVAHVARVAKGALKVTFTVPAKNGAPITGYTATCRSSNGGTTRAKKGKASPLTVNGLTSGKTYTCTVKATNRRGTGPPSRASAPLSA